MDYEEADNLSEGESSDIFCYYCMNRNRCSLVKCLQTGCGEYFCNDLTDGETTGSHIFNHLDIRGHNHIYMLNELEVECFKCKLNNCFSLCYNIDQDGAALLCRNQCLLSYQDLKSQDWKALFIEKSISQEIIPQRNPLKKVTYQEIKDMELELSRGQIKNPYEVGPDQIKRVSLRYQTVDEYRDTYQSLIELEHEYDKFYSEQESEQKVTPYWSSDYRSFTFRLVEERCHLKRNDEVVVTATGFKSSAIIEDVTSQREVSVQLVRGKFGNPELKMLVIKPGFNDVAFDRMMRALKAFNKIEESFKNVILGFPVELIGFDESEIQDFSVKGLPKLNSSQNTAVKNALTSKLFLIQGPPGTGKTVTSASIVYHFSRIINQPSQYELTTKSLSETNDLCYATANKYFNAKTEMDLRKSLIDHLLVKSGANISESMKTRFTNYYESAKHDFDAIESKKASLSTKINQLEFKLSKLSPETERKRVLVCAPSNVAVDHLVSKISQTGLKVVRFYSKSKESTKTDISHLCFHTLFNTELLKSGNREISELYKLKQTSGLTKDLRAKFEKLESAVRDIILKDVDVICCTCIGALDHRLRNLRFSKVLIDEACQSQEPECLIPLLSGSDQIVMVGDQCQLGPIIKCDIAEKAGLEHSLFERLISLGYKPFMLDTQYRMHPAISSVPSDLFYNRMLLDGVTKEQRHKILTNFRWPTAVPLFFYHIPYNEELSSTGKSYVNRGEAEAICNIIGKLGDSTEIGIITFYDAQRVVICNYLNNQKNTSNIEIASVDSFQGREKDFIILSCVRSNQKSGVGFLGNYRRLNVAITRAKYGLIICGNAETLMRSPAWNRVICSYQNNSLIFEGDLDYLHQKYIHVKELRDITFQQFVYADEFYNVGEVVNDDHWAD